MSTVTLQSLIVMIVVGVAIIYAASVFLRKSKAFSSKNDCADDCGCGSRSKTTKAVH
jgi:hypothetical protein